MLFFRNFLLLLLNANCETPSVKFSYFTEKISNLNFCSLSKKKITFHLSFLSTGFSGVNTIVYRRKLACQE